MKYLSVCSGIEAATVAWHPLGWTPLAFSEIEAFPRAVLQHHYPDVPLYGDFTKLRDEPIIADADILVGGTPCQAFSVAGLRKSLEDDRGNLTLEFVRLADAIDNARLDRGKSAPIIVWENVPGVLSVKDNAFGCFLSGLAGDDTPYVPPRGKWTNAGVVAGPKRTVAWRVLDAQYFGLAQRRRRVFVVASAREGFDPAAVLLEFEGVRRDTPPRREAGQAASGGATGRAGGGGVTEQLSDSLTVGANQTTGFSSPSVVGYSHWDDPNAPHPTLNQSAKGSGGVGASNQELFSQRGAYLVGEASTRDTVSTLTARGPYSLGIPEVDGGQIVPTTISALTASMGAGSYLGHNKDDKVVVTHSLRADGFDASETGKGDAAPCVAVFPIDMYNAKRDPEKKDAINRNAVGVGNEGDPSYTLNRVDVHGVAVVGDAAPCVAVAFAQNTRDEVREMPYVGALAAEPGMEQTSYVRQEMAVRRLTPVECERLQGFPDGYTNIPWRKKSEAPDGPRYRALGNSMAVPVMRWIGQRIAST